MSSGCGDVLSLDDLKTAKLHQTFEAEVITGLSGGVTGGASIDYATNPVTGQTQKTLPAVLRDVGFRPASFTFTSGGTLAVGDSDVAVLWSIANGGDGDYYIWKGAYPKVVPAASTPASSGGVSSSGWMPIGDIALRAQLATAGNTGLVDDSNISVLQPYTGATLRTQHAKNIDSLNIMDFGAVGDGVTDDTAAFNAALTACKAAGKALNIGSNKIYCATAVSMSGRVFLLGTGQGELIGQFTYSDTFPVSADTTTPPTETSPFFSAFGVNFRNDSLTNYALTIVAQGGSSFLDCAELSQCKFFGYYGLRGDNLISVTIDKCWFYSVYIGMEMRGCTNGNVIGCWFRNARKKAVSLTYNPSYTNRIGGENFRFTNCEFAVCTVGISAFRHVWLNVSNCLFDYCTLPIYGLGSYYAKVTGSYLGAANQGSLSGSTGYEAPPTIGCALYFKGAPADANFAGASYCGATVVNCELVNYLSGTSNPVAIMDGYISASVYQLTRHTAFIGNKFLALQSHSMTSMLSISYAAESTVSGNSFISPNLSTTLIAPYVSTNATVHNGAMNNSVECTQSSVAVPQVYDYQTSNALRGVVGAGVWLQDAGGTNKLGVNASNRVALVNADVATSATAGSYSLPSGATGFVIVSINGGNVKIPYYGI